MVSHNGCFILAITSSSSGSAYIEIEERYCEIAAKRLSQEVFEFELPAPETAPVNEELDFAG